MALLDNTQVLVQLKAPKAMLVLYKLFKNSSNFAISRTCLKPNANILLQKNFVFGDLR